jgi:hypothetical protein
MVAFQLSGKATRDALYLSTFGVATLPRMVIVAALLSALLTIGLSRVMGRVGPGRLIPRLFVLSALLLLVEWSLIAGFRAWVAIAFYLHFSALGALLVSGFWAMVTERFDPRSARHTIGRITTGASIGGLLGGILPGQLGGVLPLSAMFPLLAVMHLAAALLIRGVRTAANEAGEPGGRGGPATSGSAREAFRASPYLRGLALLVVLTAMTEGLLDWVFKVRATAAAPSGEELLRLFAAFYAVTALLAILLQATALKSTLSGLGVARSAALLPAGVSLGAVGGLLLPGLVPLLVARGTEIVLRNSIFRSAYELLFTPVPPAEKRATKLFIDVGATRLGDLAGGALIQIVLLVAAARAGGVLLGAAILLALLSLLVARRLHRGHTEALARSLTLRADQAPPDQPGESSALLQTIGGFDLQQLRTAPVAAAAAPPRTVAGRDGDSVRRSALASGDTPAVLEALRVAPLTPALVGPAVQLLAWDEAAPAAIEALIAVARSETATLAKFLLNPEEDFAIRRRLVLVLAKCPTAESFDALLGALDDRRFEVRYRAGRALYRLSAEVPELRAPRERVLAAVLREVAVGRGVWESRRLIDAAEDEEEAPLEAQLVRDRADRSLEHVFTLLALMLPREPLRLAFHGLFTEDRQLRGTALEYLESVLPEPVREKLWPFLEPGSVRRPGGGRPANEALENLLQSRESIVLALAAVRRKEAGQGG